MKFGQKVKLKKWFLPFVPFIALFLICIYLEYESPGLLASILDLPRIVFGTAALIGCLVCSLIYAVSAILKEVTEE